jgi:hypothetical protein
MLGTAICSPKIVGVKSMAQWLSNRFLRVAGILFALCLSRLATAQQITVKLVDGRNGRALQNQSVAIWLAEKPAGVPAQTVLTNADGIAYFPVPTPLASFVIGGEGLVDCRERLTYTGNAKRYEAEKDTVNKEEVYRFADVLSHGVVTANRCGKAVAQPVAGQLVLFARPPHWWERVLWE